MTPRSPQLADLGAAIRRLRSDRGFSQEGLALEAGLDRAYLGGVERGERNPTYETIRQVAATVGIPASELVAAAEAEEALRRSKRRR